MGIHSGFLTAFGERGHVSRWRRAVSGSYGLGALENCPYAPAYYLISVLKRRTR